MLLGVLAMTAFMSAQAGPVDPFLQSLVNDLNQGLPRTIDRTTRLDTARAGAGNRLTYYFTITTQDVANLNVKQLRAKQIPKARNGACTTPNIRALLDAGVTYVYHYSDRSGRFVTEFEISSADCT